VQPCFGQQIAHRRHVGRTRRHRCGHRYSQAVVTKLAAHLDHFHHRTGAVLLAVSGTQPLPKLIVASRPPPRLPPLRQRFGASERARLMSEHIEIVFEIEHVLTALMAALVPRDLAAAVPDLDMRRTDAHLHPGARLRRRRGEIGLHRHAAVLVDQRKDDFSEVESLGDARVQMRPLFCQQRANALCAPVEHPRFIFAAAGKQKFIKRIDISHIGNRNQVVAPEVTAFALNAAFFMPFAGRAELGLEAPMRAKCRKAHRLLPPMTAQDLAHGTAEVVVAK
jgi:hypothetical protein